jgi:hypothetical protein
MIILERERNKRFQVGDSRIDFQHPYCTPAVEYLTM